MKIELSATREIVGAVFLGADEIFGNDAFTMVYCCCAKMTHVTTDVVDASIRELVAILENGEAVDAATRLEDHGDYELVSVETATEDIAEIIRALHFLSQDMSDIETHDDALKARAEALRSSKPPARH